MIITILLGIYTAIIVVRFVILFASICKYLGYAAKPHQWVYLPWHWNMWTPKSYYNWEKKNAKR